MDDFSIVILVLLALAVLLLGPLSFFLTLGARSRLAETQRLVRSLDAQLSQVQLHLDKVSRDGTAVPPSQETDGAPETAGGTSETGPLEDAGESSAPDSEPELAARTSVAKRERRTSMPPSAGSTAAFGFDSDPSSGETPPPGGPPPSCPGVQPAQPPQGRGPKGPGLEERLGTRWTVWIGGLALALGALLLVRYAIDQGWFGPGARVLMGLALAIALIAAGEKLRRQEKRQASGQAPAEAAPEPDAQDRLVPDLSRPSIPAMLTAAGTIAAFGSIYAAHALYGFIGPALAFIALGATAIATMFAAGLHGPMLAGLGLAGSLVAPVLVSSSNPSPWPVVLYLAVVAVATYGLARLRAWLWLALAAAIGAGIWTLLFLEPVRSANIGVSFYHGALVHLVVQSALALFALAHEPYRGLQDNGRKLDVLPTLVAAGIAVLTILVLGTATAQEFSTLWFISAALVAGMLAANGLLTLQSAIAVATAGLVCVAAIAVWPSPESFSLAARSWEEVELAGLPPPIRAQAYGAFALIVSLTLACAALWRVLRDANLSVLHTSLFAGTAALTPLAGLIAAYGRMTSGAPSMLFAALAAALAVAFVVAAQIFRNGIADHKPAAWDLGLGICASAAIAALALGLTFALEGGTLTIALGLAALGAAIVAVQLDIPALRWCTAGLALVLALRFLWEPRIVHELGPTPVFNWLLAGYGIPALSFGASAWLLRRSFGEDRPVRITQAMAILCTALLVYFEIRHFVFSGDVLGVRSRLVEQGLLAIASFGFAIVLMQLDGRHASPVFRYASYLFGIVSAIICLLGLGLAYNPLLAWRGEPVSGGSVFNVLLLAYLLPGLMGLLLGRMADGIRPRWYVIGARIVAMALIFGYLTLQVRRAFQGSFIGFSRYTSDGEWYTYSAVWLVFGIVLLAYGLWRKSVEVRLASAVFIVLSVVKVFLFDLAGLDGILRALSFIGLGGVLIGIGLVYQKYVFAPPAAAGGQGNKSGV